MDTLFWMSVIAIGLLLAARLIIPKTAPNSRMAELLRRHISLED